MSIAVGDILEGNVLNIMQYGAFVQLPDNQKGLVHISEVSSKYVTDINDVLKVGQIVKIKVLTVENNKISLSIKKAQDNFEEPKREFKKNFRNDNFNKEPAKPQTFEDVLAKFMKDSEERQTDIKKSFESKRGSNSARRV